MESKEPVYISVSLDSSYYVYLFVFFLNRFAPSSSCETESIKVYDGPSTTSPLLGQICNDTDAVPVLQSSSDSLTFLITTNSVVFTRNFFVFYYFISETGKSLMQSLVPVELHH